MDSLDNLPLDESHSATPAEMQILSKYFGNKKQNKKVWTEVKEVVLATVLFMLLSNEYFDKLLVQLPHTDSMIVRLGLKALIYAVALYVSIIMLC
jgi:hypothetical protein